MKMQERNSLTQDLALTLKAKLFRGLADPSRLAILEALRKSETRYVSCRSEIGAVLMALGYTRATRRPSACLVSNGAGVAYSVGGITACYKAHIPVLVLSGETSRPLRGLGAFQELDATALLTPITKFTMTLGSPESVARVMFRLFALAMEGPRGPVHLGLPSDLLEIPVPAGRDTQHEAGVLPSAPATEAVTTVLEELQRARRPVLFVGDEVTWSGATKLCFALAERLEIPSITPLTNPDAFPVSHPLGLGPLGPHGWESARHVVRQADLLLAIGTTLDHFSTGFRRNLLRPGTHVIQVGPAASREVGFYRPSLILTCDVEPFLSRLLAEVERVGFRPRYWSGTSIRRVKIWWAKRYAARVRSAAGPLRIAEVVRALRSRMAAEDILVCDSGNFEYQVYRHFPAWAPGTFFYCDGLGAMGTSLPVAIGAKLGSPRRRLVALCGDGGLCSMLAELETAVRERLNVVVVVLNDSSYGSIKAYQLARPGRRVFGVEHGNPNFAQVARAFGASGFQVRSRRALARVLARAWRSRKPVVVEVKLKKPEMAAPAF